MRKLKERFARFFSRDDARPVQIRQYMLAGALFSGALGFLVVMILILDPPETPLAMKAPDAAREIESSGTRIRPEEMWRFQMEEDAKKLRDAIKSLQDSLSQKQQEKQNDAYVQKLEAAIEAQLPDLQARLAQKTTNLPNTLPAPPSALPLASPSAPRSVSPSSLNSIQKFTLSAWGAPPPVPKTVLNTIPAGAFARSVLLSGLDASAAMSAFSDPRPLLLRLRPVFPGRSTLSSRDFPGKREILWGFKDTRPPTSRAIPC